MDCGLTWAVGISTFLSEVTDSPVVQANARRLWKSLKNIDSVPDSKVRGANMGPIWGRQDPAGSNVGPVNLAIWGIALSPLHKLEFHKSLLVSV